ncbi:MAG TPA: hypothetical protein PKY82_33040, partial [Pyrinomonadaceae bacterium]|nr:hypothetical protein [Pyrinomonadaceae bacterium]
MQKSFLQSLLIKVSSLFSVIFLTVGLIFLYSSYFGIETNVKLGLLLTTLGGVSAFAIIAFMNFSLSSAQSELKESTQIAHQLA